MSVTAPFLTDEFLWRGHTVRHARFGQGPPVVLCHGTPWSSLVWRTIIDALAPTWSVYVWDMFGYGQSDKPDDDVSLRTQGELLVALVGHWQIDRPHVVAHDYGGAVALRAHLLHRLDIASLALIDVVVLRPWGSPFFRLVTENSDVFDALPANLHRVLVREYISGASHTGLRADVAEQLLEPWLGAGQAAFYRQIAQADEALTAELEPLLGDITVPTLIIWGTEDTWIPADRADRLAAAIPGSEVQLINDAGHLVQEDQPAALTLAVHQWLTRQHP